MHLAPSLSHRKLRVHIGLTNIANVPKLNTFEQTPAGRSEIYCENFRFNNHTCCRNL